MTRLKPATLAYLNHAAAVAAMRNQLLNILAWLAILFAMPYVWG